MSAPRVLVVDDSEITRAVLVRTLENAGFEVISARDGLEGAVKALSERPAVVVIDLEMPVMDGYQLLRLLKNEPASAHIPVLILTSHGEASSRYWGLRTGADAYLTKDFQSAELVSTVTRLARQAEPTIAALLAPPGGPLDILARVARQLDASLLRATLANVLLERGLAPADLHGASRTALQLFAEVVDVYLLAIAVIEPEAVTLDIVLAGPVSLAVVERCASAVLSSLPITPGATVDAAVTGEKDGASDVNPDELLTFPLPLRGASGTLALLPRDGQRFAASSRDLVQALAPHLALVLDNARLGQRLQELSTHDGLTKLLNHRAVHERLTDELARAQRYDHPLTAILCDIDFFKRVNDAHGHLAGDAVLRAAAAAMQRTLRQSDSFGRYGGEEFLAVLAETDLEAGQATAERLRRALADQPIPLPQSGAISITASFGVACRAELGPEASPDALVSLADTRLYQAKAAGRNCVRP